METDEVKKNKRIKHCFNKHELFHIWANNPQYAYCRSGRDITSMHGCLFAGHLYDRSKEDIINDTYNLYSKSIIAVINYKERIAVVNPDMNDSWETIRALNKGYTIFQTNIIDIPSVLNGNYYTIIKNTLLYNVNLIYKYYISDIYSYLSGARQTCNISYNGLDFDIKSCINRYNYAVVIRILLDKTLNGKKNGKKVRNTDLFTKPLADTVNIAYKTKVKCPSIKQLLEGKIFTKSENRIISIAAFYRKHIYGHGLISFKNLEKHWDEDLDTAILKEECKKHSIKYPEDHKFKDGITEYNITKFQHIYAFLGRVFTNIEAVHRQRLVNEENENRRRAIEELNRTFNPTIMLDKWRKNKMPILKLTYNRWNYASNRWEPYSTNYTYSFPTTQLRLNKDNNRIETSRYAVVPLEGAKSLFKFINNCIEFYNNEVRTNHLTEFKIYCIKNRSDAQNTIPVDIHISVRTSVFDKNYVSLILKTPIKIGYFALTSIEFNSKTNDMTGKVIDSNPRWLVHIGCHTLYLDDFAEFVKYYKLEEYFNIKNYERN